MVRFAHDVGFNRHCDVARVLVGWLKVLTSPLGQMQRKRVILLTGASTGLGLVLARRLIATGDQIILTARQESLNRFESEKIYASDNVWIRPLDVIKPEDRLRLIEEVNAKLGGVDVLINNAGFAHHAFKTIRSHHKCVLRWRHDGNADNGNLQCFEICPRRR